MDRFQISNEQILNSAARVIATEREGLAALNAAFEGPLKQTFCQAVETLSRLEGRVIVTGVGKSGHIGTKIAATLASTGTPAFFVHSTEANHGDLGMIARDDAILALSWSGETTELSGVLSYSRRFAIPLIAITAGAKSALARAADIGLILPKVAEACPHGLAPTTSTIMQLATGDALAVALLEQRGFTSDDFSTFHPGGKLGASLTKLADIMHTGDAVPLVAQGASMREAIVTMSQKSFGCAGVVDDEGLLVGIVTDGDIRRHIDADLLSMRADEVMTCDPKTAAPELFAASALNTLNEAEITSLIVVEERRPVGIVHLHDLLRLGTA